MHGRLMFHQSGGCCDGSSPMCYPDGEFIVGGSDVRLGDLRVAGAEQGLTMDDNVAAFGELGFRPRLADLPRDRDQSTRVLGEEISLPVIISPTGVQAVSPDGEVAVARAAAAAGTAIGLSSFASKAIEDVAEA